MIPSKKSGEKCPQIDERAKNENSTKMTPKIITGTTTPNLLYKPGKIHKV
jgi:hypothetical protein